MYITSETTNEERDKIFKSRDVKDYYVYIEGDLEPSLGKKIKTLVVAAESYIVYIDTDDYVEWSYNDKYEEAEEFEKKHAIVLARIAYLEEISNDTFKGSEKLAFRRLLGESIARLFKEKNEEEASQILDKAEQLVKSKNRWIIIKHALIMTGIVVGVELFLWFYYQNWLSDFPDWLKNTLEFGICSLAGGIGGFSFLLIRSKTLEIEPALGIGMYKKEGRMRIVYGIMGGILVYIALNVKLIFGNIENPNFSLLTFFICLIGGASEKIIPSLIEKIEGKI
jgi:hypothetical protein